MKTLMEDFIRSIIKIIYNNFIIGIKKEIRNRDFAV